MKKTESLFYEMVEGGSERLGEEKDDMSRADLPSVRSSTIDKSAPGPSITSAHTTTTVAVVPLSKVHAIPRRQQQPTNNQLPC